MAAIDTFEWFVWKFYPNADAPALEFLKKERQYLLAFRNEDERLRYIGELMLQVRETVSQTTT